MTDSEALWYCQQGDADPTGPGTTADLVSAIRAGNITKAARVSSGADARWTPITDVPAFAIAFRDAPPKASEPVVPAAPPAHLALADDEADLGPREPPSPKPMFWAAAAIVLATLIWEAFAWIGTSRIREHTVSAAVDARLTLYMIVLPGVALVTAVVLGVVGLSRHGRRKDWLLEREASAPTRR